MGGIVKQDRDYVPGTVKTDPVTTEDLPDYQKGADEPDSSHAEPELESSEDAEDAPESTEDAPESSPSQVDPAADTDESEPSGEVSG